MPPSPICQIIPLGLVDYRRAWDLQLHIAEGVRAGNLPNTLLLLEHPPVYTLGRLSKPEHLKLTPGQLAAAGIDLVETDRGGQVTYHGPGQLVAYPVVNLRGWTPPGEKDGGPLRYVRSLEQAIIRTLADVQVEAHLVEGLTGVWVNDAKIGAIGVKISGGVAFHGLSINVNTDLSYYHHIIPCGIEDRPVTSIAQVLGRPVDDEEVRYSLAYQFGRVMGFTMMDKEPSRCPALNP